MKIKYTIYIVMKEIFLLNFLLFSCLISLNAQKPAVGTVKIASATKELRQQSFEKVWKTVNEKHYDPTFGGVDWLKMRGIYEPKATAATTDAQFNTVLNRMLGELKLSHFVVYTPSAVENAKIVDGVTGIKLKWIDNQPVVSRVEKNSTAEKAGIKTGYVISKVNGKTVVELLAPLEKSFVERNLNDAKKNLYRQFVLLGYIDGDTATKVKIEALNGLNQPQIYDTARAELKSEMSPAVGNFPPQEVVFESKLLGNNVGYIRFNIWVIPQMPKIREAIRSLKDANGIVFDLRGNPGGIGGMAPGIAGLLSDKQFSLGTMNSRDNELKFIAYPQTAPYPGKVVIITDGGSGSTSEIFAAGMQENERAKIVGERSAGQILVSLFDTLPTGAIFQYAISDYKSPKNILIEGRGVIPDVEVKTTRQTLLEGRDAQMEEAVKLITK
jgi:carboxyl-terminal processing protease